MNKQCFGFCKNETISYKIHHLIADNLLGGAQLPKIIDRYSDMCANFNKYPEDFAETKDDKWVFSANLSPFVPKGWNRCYGDTTAVPIPITHPDFIDLTTRNIKPGAIGLDLPIWFSPTPDAPFVMIVSQDPLRSAEWYGDKKDEKFICNDAIVSSPFGLQDAHHREKGNGGKRIWLLVQALIEKGYNVYLTDSRKFFVYDHHESDIYTTSEKMSVYRKILNQEIEIINPKLIVTLGHSAEKCCRSLLGDDYRLSGYIPHFSGSAGKKINDFFGVKGKTDVTALANLYGDFIDNLIKRRQN